MPPRTGSSCLWRKTTYHYLRPMLAQLPQEGAFCPRPSPWGRRWREPAPPRRRTGGSGLPDAPEKRTGRPYRQRFSNREIAQKLYLLRGEREAVHQPALRQAGSPGRRPHQATGAWQIWARVLANGELEKPKRHCRLSGTVGLFIIPERRSALERKYISAKLPCGITFCRWICIRQPALLDMKPYLDKLRFSPLTDLQVWRSA